MLCFEKCMQLNIVLVALIITQFEFINYWKMWTQVPKNVITRPVVSIFFWTFIIKRLYKGEVGMIVSKHTPTGVVSTYSGTSLCLLVLLVKVITWAWVPHGRYCHSSDVATVPISALRPSGFTLLLCQYLPCGTREAHVITSSLHDIYYRALFNILCVSVWKCRRICCSSPHLQLMRTFCPCALSANWRAGYVLYRTLCCH